MSRTRWLVTGIVALALAATLVFDLVAEPRPKGGWIYRCEAAARLTGGDVDALRTLDEQGEAQGFDSIAWKMKDYGHPGLGLSILWGMGVSADIARDSGADGELMMKLIPPRPGSSGHFTLHRLGADRSIPGPVAQPDVKPDDGTAFFRINEIIAFAGPDTMLAWSYESEGSASAAPASGIIDMVPLREAVVAMPGLRRRLDADARRYATACRRLPARGPYWR